MPAKRILRRLGLFSFIKNGGLEFQTRDSLLWTNCLANGLVDVGVATGGF